MRSILHLCLLVLAVPVLADDPIDTGAGSFASWKGKHTTELFAELGQPNKTKRDGKRGKVLVYRLRFYGNQVIGETKISWSEAGIGPSPRHDEDRRDPGSTTGPRLSYSGSLAASAKQKVKFYVDAQGIIQREEFGPRKWKGRQD